MSNRGRQIYKPEFRFGLGGASLGNEFSKLTDKDAEATLESACCTPAHGTAYEIAGKGSRHRSHTRGGPASRRNGAETKTGLILRCAPRQMPGFSCVFVANLRKGSIRGHEPRQIARVSAKNLSSKGLPPSF
jgi:hypothetical protein